MNDSASNPRRVLMIEDEADIQTIAGMALENIGGFTVEICSSGRDALARATDFAPDVILLDVMMPEMDGPTTLRMLRELPATADVPIIFMTAKVQPPEIEDYKAMGALDVIVKPFDPMTLPDVIRGILTAHAED